MKNPIDNNWAALAVTIICGALVFADAPLLAAFVAVVYLTA